MMVGKELPTVGSCGSCWAIKMDVGVGVGWRVGLGVEVAPDGVVGVGEGVGVVEVLWQLLFPGLFLCLHKVVVPVL